ncbi:MAG: methylated-DNA--[protein]-cysteine S-methyltransferase [Thermoleophilia bacterium]|nr:methylated-DNA--[protein]-cysteine S-methyltransferase [Thermoleophilia bacterium]
MAAFYDGMRYVLYEVPGWGVGELWLEGDVVVNHELPAARSRRGDRSPHPLAERVRAYFRGEVDSFADVGLDLGWCTPFQRAVLHALRRIPYGETLTYGELALLAGYPRAQRAAGTVCAGNRFALFVPCHRVVAAGSLGRYGALGTAYKERLLALEGVHLPPAL